MCEANVYINRDGHEELFMEKVDRVVPGEDDTIFMENIFGERRVIKARIREMELVHHRIIVQPIEEQPVGQHLELWLEPATDHGHFHPGEEVILKLFKGYNMKPSGEARFCSPRAFVVKDGVSEEVELHEHHRVLEVNLGEKADGLLTVYARENGETQLYAKVIVEIGHHHHQGLKPVGLPVEIIPHNYSHVHLGDNYEIQVLKEGRPLAGARVRATYGGNHNRAYPVQLVTDEEGRARVFLSARGNWLFSVQDGDVISTFTLIKSF